MPMLKGKKWGDPKYVSKKDDKWRRRVRNIVERPKQPGEDKQDMSYSHKGSSHNPGY